MYLNVNLCNDLGNIYPVTAKFCHIVCPSICARIFYTGDDDSLGTYCVSKVLFFIWGTALKSLWIKTYRYTADKN